MTNEEALNIKDEILRKEGSIHICNTITIDGVVLIKDMLIKEVLTYINRIR